MKKWIVSLAILIITIFLISSCTSDVQSPVITSLMAEQPTLPPSGWSNIHCTAWGRDGDSLTYNWSASGGNLSGQVSSGITSSVTWKAPDVVGKYTITVKVIDNNGTQDTGHIILLVTTNHPPTITSLVTDADDNWVKPSGSCRIECQAEDQDGDKLTYAWEASSGRISGRGTVVTWTAPKAEGSYRVAVLVSDSEGGEGRSSMNITVALTQPPQRPPVIGSLVVTPKESEYMKGEKIYQGKSCELKCLASDPDGDGLSYDWSADGGELSGEGPVVTWTAPLNPDHPVTVMVTVSDNVGGTATESKVFDVVTCTCALR